ncbi:MAG: ABC transporter ATP-binding protein [Actinomycetota bacterium]|jgi:ATP-binding cassette subfamily B protein|nr:ABC transporter ATP-binding protein [Actinomycetota bacterium]
MTDERTKGIVGVPILRPSLGLLRPYRRDLAIALSTLLGSLACVLAGPALVSYAINHGLVHHHDARVIEVAGVLYLCLALGFFFFSRVQTRMLSGTGELILNDLRKRVFRHLLAQPLAFFESESSAQLLARMTADIDVLESLVQSGIGSFLTSVGLFFTSLIVLVVMSPVLFGVTVICLIPVTLAAARYRVTSTRAYTLVRHRIGDTLATLDEGLAGVRVVQAFRQERRLERQFGVRNKQQLEATLDTARLSARFFPLVEGSGVLSAAALLVLGGVFVHLHLTSVGVVAAFILYTTNLFAAVQSVSQLFDLLQSSGAALGTVFSLLSVEPTMQDPPHPVALAPHGALELDHVGFAYPPRTQHDGKEHVAAPNALVDVTLVIAPGEHLVLVGPTGAGKSTLAKLIGRLYDPTVGEVRFGGVALARATIAELRRRVVVVPQEGFLFRGSVLDNIKMGNVEASESEVLAVLERLGIDRHLLSLQGGLHGDVGERGSRLSAGERQLVSLARAALADPAVLVLDEATSSLDPGTELEVEHAVSVLAVNRTTVTVAHRLTTAERADRIAVVAEGRIVELGPHAELMALGGSYAALFSAWSAGALNATR